MSKADEPSPVLIVLETFGTDVEGVATTYRKGETIDPRHPSVKRWPKLFGPLTLDHPVPASVLSFAAKMAKARADAKAAKELEAARAAAAAKQAEEEPATQAAAEAKAAEEAAAAVLEPTPVQDAIAAPEVRT